VQIHRKNELKNMEKFEEKEFIDCWKEKMKCLVNIFLEI
jgi:hypothetical protein